MCGYEFDDTRYNTWLGMAQKIFTSYVWGLSFKFILTYSGSTVTFFLGGA